MRAANDLVAEAEARIGSTLRGKWRIDRLIGIGGTAAVYEAQHRNRSRVAVKVLHRHVALSSTQLARFRREGYAANRVGHAGVVQVFDDDIEDGGSPFLVMELLSGRTMAERARAERGLLPPEEVLAHADRLLDVLVAAHANGILHRDIKPENLFLTTAGDLKVLDFGIARLTEPTPDCSTTVAGTLLGTPAFCSPEQARGRLDEMDERSDIWAVGATLFTLLSGRYVHEGSTPNEQLGAAISTQARSLGGVVPNLPAALVQLVDRSLAYDWLDRWPSAREMQEAVRWIRESWPLLATEPGLMPAEWSPGGLPPKAGESPRTLEDDGALPVVERPDSWRRAKSAAVVVVALGAASLVAFRSYSMRADGKAALDASLPLVKQAEHVAGPEGNDRVDALVTPPVQVERASWAEADFAAPRSTRLRHPGPSSRPSAVPPAAATAAEVKTEVEVEQPSSQASAGARGAFDRRH